MPWPQGKFGRVLDLDAPENFFDFICAWPLIFREIVSVIPHLNLKKIEEERRALVVRGEVATGASFGIFGVTICFGGSPFFETRKSPHP